MFSPMTAIQQGQWPQASKCGHILPTPLPAAGGDVVTACSQAFGMSTAPRDVLRPYTACGGHAAVGCGKVGISSPGG